MQRSTTYKVYTFLNWIFSLHCSCTVKASLPPIFFYFFLQSLESKILQFVFPISSILVFVHAISVCIFFLVFCLLEDEGVIWTILTIFLLKKIPSTFKQNECVKNEMVKDISSGHSCNGCLAPGIWSWSYIHSTLLYLSQITNMEYKKEKLVR